MEFIEATSEEIRCCSPMCDMYVCEKCAYSCPADIPRWKVIWEERREVIVKAESAEEAERMVREGKHEETNDAVTVPPYALPME